MDNIAQIKRRQILIDLIEEWNANRLDLFAIKLSEENLIYGGVMRFLFQDSGSKLATKCIRVTSTQTTKDIIETLVEKFRPDMKMLTTPIYYLYEVDSNGVERRLEADEFPLEVQLNWTNDEKEGKFVLRNADHKPINVNKADTNEPTFKRKMSKREKKEARKKNQNTADVIDRDDHEEPSGVFVRTKSNSEAVMKKRRELKVQKKLDEIQKEGDQGGLLKIHGDSLNVDVPYKSLLLSVHDSAEYVVREMLDKYGLSKRNAGDYCLVQVFNAHAGEIGGGLRPQEHILNDDECPLAILQLQVNRGNITFHVRRRDGKRHADTDNKTPYLLELNLDGTDIKKPKQHPLHINMTEVGSVAVPSSGQHLRLIGPTILPHHAVIANIESVVTITPTNSEAECFVEGQRIFETSVLKHGKVVRFGHHHAFRFVDPRLDDGSGGRLMSENGTMLSDGADGSAGFGKLDDVLPAGLEFRDEGEDNFLHSVISDITEGMCTFKLAPCYSLYLAARYRVDRVTQGISPDEHQQHIAMFVNKIAFMIRDVVSRYRNSPQECAFWMANMSELLHFLKMDRDLSINSPQAQDVLADSIQESFRDLVYIMQADLYQSMPAFLSDNDNDQEAGEVLHVLSSAMSLLRRCRVNAALTIQLFSQLFHFINMWLFNKLVIEPQLGLITLRWGERIKRRLDRVEAWAEKQGLELAADCHLCRITQAAKLLQSSKHINDIPSISSSCYKLNSIQMRVLLERYIPEQGEPRVSQDVIEKVVSVARNTADDLSRTENKEIKLEEDADLQLPFLLPEDGYSSDIVKGIPQGLGEFLEPVMADGLCRLTPLPAQTGSWQSLFSNSQVFMNDEEPEPIHSPNLSPQPNSPPADQPEIIDIQLHKVNGSMGLSIVAAKGDSQSEKGIYIKSVVDGGAGDQDGRLQAGDQLLTVDGNNLIGLTQERAADLMKETGQVVALKVAKQGAFYHGLATLLNQLTPPMNREGLNMQQSKSTPILAGQLSPGYPGPPPLGGHPPISHEDMRSASSGNLLKKDEMRNPNQVNNRGAISQPNLMNDEMESENYQNVPTPNHRPLSQYNRMDGSGPPMNHPGSPQSDRPRSEWYDPDWNPLPHGGFVNRQPIYQNQPINNQMKGHAPPTVGPYGRPGGFENRELPPPPDEDRAPPVPPHPTNMSLGSNEDLPPPPPSNYVNFQPNSSYNAPISQYNPPTSAPSSQYNPPTSAPSSQYNPPTSAPSSQYNPPSSQYNPTPNQFPKSAPEQPQTGYNQPPVNTQPNRYAEAPRGSVSDSRQPSGPAAGGLQSAGSSQPPPWARGAPRTATPAQQPRFTGAGSQPRSPANSLPRGINPPTSQPGQGDLMRTAPQIQPYRPPEPDSFTTRAPRPQRPTGPAALYTRPPPPSINRPPAPGGHKAPTTQSAPVPRNPLNTNPPRAAVSQNNSFRNPEPRRPGVQRVDVIRDLEQKPYRSSDEEERLARLKLDEEFERRAQQQDDDEPLNRSGVGSMGRPGPPQGYQPGPPVNNSFNRNNSAANNTLKQAGANKSVTFKPAYQSSEPPRAEYKPAVYKPAVNTSSDLTNNSRMPPAPTQDYLRQQQEPGLNSSPKSGPLSNPDRDALRIRLEEEMREKQRREGETSRRNLHQQEEEEQRYRREHDLNHRKESERFQMQQLSDAREDQNRMINQRPNNLPQPQTEMRSNGLNGSDRPTSYNRLSTGPQPYRQPEPFNRTSTVSLNSPSSNPPNNRQSFGQFPPTSSYNPVQPASSYNREPNYNNSSNSAPYDPPNSGYNRYQTQPGVYNDMSPINQSRSSINFDNSQTGSTPGVIGAQEVYRDPRSRIEAQQKAQKLKSDGDQLSFTQKMKMFASEAGEHTPVQKAKASRTQRVLEDQMAYGGGG